MRTLLNGVGANTGDGLLHLKEKAFNRTIIKKPYSDSCSNCTTLPVSPDSTPSEGSRIDSLQYGCNGSALVVTQSRVKELLKRASYGLQFGNEGTRIAKLQQMQQACSTDSLLNRPILQQQCPPLPPPPAPPARACPLTKNQK